MYRGLLLCERTLVRLTRVIKDQGGRDRVHGRYCHRDDGAAWRATIHGRNEPTVREFDPLVSIGV